MHCYFFFSYKYFVETSNISTKNLLLRCALKYKNFRSSLSHFPLFLAMMATPRSEVYQWLCSNSNALELERLAGESESRGFRTVDSLKYIKSPDLDVLFPSPHKLMMAEKQIIESVIEKVKSLKSRQLPPRQLFPALPRQLSYDQTPTFNSPSAANFVFLNNTSINKTFRLTAKTSEEAGVGKVTEPQVSTQPASYLKRREDYVKHDNDLLAAQIQSANDVLEMNFSNYRVLKTREFENYGSGSIERKKLCSACHLPGHKKTNAETPHVKILTFVTFVTNIQNSEQRFKI